MRSFSTMHKMGSCNKTNDTLVSPLNGTSNKMGTLENLDSYHEEETDTFQETAKLTSVQSNGHKPQHIDNTGGNDDENCIDKILQNISSTMGQPVSSRYKPARKGKSPKSHVTVKRSNSDVPHLPLNSDELRLNNANKPDVRRRRTSITQGIGPVNQTPGSPDTNRQSFELKQNAIYSMQTDGTLEHHSALENLRVEEQWNNSQNLWRRLAIRASDPDTSQKELIQRSTFLVISALTVGAGGVWGLMYVAFDEWVAALMPFSYSTIMSLVLFTCICNGRKGTGYGYDTFVVCQLFLILMLPFAVHVALGGVEKSGGVMLWSFLCPMGAAFFRTAKESLRWFWLFLSISGLLLVQGFWDVSDVPVYEGADMIGISTTSLSPSERIQKLYFLMNIIGCKCVIFAAVFLFARELEKEYTKSEEVLLNILPSMIVKRIKRGEFPIVDHVADVTILFADLVGFTKASTEHHPNFLIGLFLRDIFQAFDELVYKHGLEKIKTIGDAYMAVGGLNHGEKLSAHSQSQSAQYKDQASYATNTMMMAVDMYKALDQVNKKYNLDFDLRIGVHTGPVVAGVIGLKRFTYDVWGDSVNVSELMDGRCLCFFCLIFSHTHVLSTTCYPLSRLQAEWNPTVCQD